MAKLYLSAITQLYKYYKNMKKLLVATTIMLFAFTMTFAQNSENTFKKNEISLAPYTANFTYYTTPQNGWENYSSFNLLESNYRRYLNENTALRFGGKVGFSGSNGNFSVSELNIRAGFEKHYTLSPKFQLYGGAQLNLSKYGIATDDFNAHSLSLDFIGGLRYNINDKWSLSSEIISPVRYGWSSRGSSVWETGVEWQPLKLNFRF